MPFWRCDSRRQKGIRDYADEAFLALRLAASTRDPGARALMRAAYIGEIGKLALTVLFFSMVFTLVKPLAAGPLFVGFIAAQLAVFSGFFIKD